MWWVVFEVFLGFCIGDLFFYFVICGFLLEIGRVVGVKGLIIVDGRKFNIEKIVFLSIIWIRFYYFILVKEYFFLIWEISEGYWSEVCRIDVEGWLDVGVRGEVGVVGGGVG